MKKKRKGSPRQNQVTAPQPPQTYVYIFVIFVLDHPQQHKEEWPTDRLYF